MIKFPIFLILLFIAPLNLYGTEINEPLILKSNFWDIKYNSSDNSRSFSSRSYTMKNPDYENIIFELFDIKIINSSDMSSELEDIGSLIIDGFQERRPKIKVDQGKLNLDLLNEEFEGKALLYSYTQEDHQPSTEVYIVIFLLNDGEGVWGGNYIGPEQLWREALTLLKDIRSNK